MSYIFISYLGGTVYWIFIKFCKTNLEDELKFENKERNILTFIISVLIIGFFSVKVF